VGALARWPVEVSAMPRYYFHFSDGFFVADNKGAVFPTREEASLHASHIAAEYGRNRENVDANLCVCVTDQSGEEVFRTPVIDHSYKMKAKRTVKAVGSQGARKEK
jgi:hypothetical protein